MQTPHGLQLDDPEIYRFGCIPGGLQVESNWSMWGSVKYTKLRKLAIEARKLAKTR